LRQVFTRRLAMRGLFQMNEKQRAKWECTRAKGMWRFVLLSGVVCWGGLMSVATYFLNPRNPAVTVPIYLAGGFVFGLACWHLGEHMYRKSSGSVPSS
jgi:hypothetical protein